MNLITMQDAIRGLPDSDLMVAANQPGMHQFLAFGEMAERKRVRESYEKAKAKAQPTVAERLSAPMMAPQMQAAQTPGGLAAAAPQGYAHGGLVRKYAEGGVVRHPDVTVIAPRPQVPVQEEVAVEEPELPKPKLMDMSYMASLQAAAQPTIDEIGMTWADLQRRLVEMRPADRTQAALDAVQEQATRDAQRDQRDKWLALAAAGLGAASAKSPDFLTNLVQGGVSGLEALVGANTAQAQREQARVTREEAARRAQAERELALYGIDSRAVTSGTEAVTRTQGDVLGRAVTGQTVWEELMQRMADSQANREHQARVAAADRGSRLQIAREQERGATGRTAMQIRAKIEEDRLRGEQAAADAIMSMEAAPEEKAAMLRAIKTPAPASRGGMASAASAPVAPASALAVAPGGLAAADPPAFVKREVQSIMGRESLDTVAEIRARFANDPVRLDYALRLHQQRITPRER